MEFSVEQIQVVNNNTTSITSKDDQLNMIEVIGKIIKEEINTVNERDIYPTPEDMNNMDNLNSTLTPCLLKLLETIIPGELKRMAIGHTIMSASKKNFLSPLLFGVGVQLDHSFGSKWL